MGEGGSMVVTVPGGSGRRGARKMMETEDALVGWLLETELCYCFVHGSADRRSGVNLAIQK